MKNFGEKEAWAYPGTAQIFWVPPIISGMGKATYFKLGWYIQRVHLNIRLSPLKILEKRKYGHNQGLPIFFGFPLLSQEQVKLQISNFASLHAHLWAQSEQKPIKKSGKVAVGVVCLTVV